MEKGCLSDLARPGARITVRVTPRAARDRLTREEGQVRICVTAAPEDGKANLAVAKLLARALGVARTRLRLVRGETSREKVFELT